MILLHKMVKIGRYEYQKSTRITKKLMTVVNGKTVHFGDRNSDHFKDKTGTWKSKDHGDKERRKSYLSRSAGIKNKSGKLTKDDPMSPNYHARRILW
tara:strand:- start:89 stop:379 length:291 start_codon:yes stop_codon:yes gene_type:complete